MIEQHRQLRRRQGDLAFLRRWPHEPALLQPLAEQARALTIPPDDLDQIAKSAIIPHTKNGNCGLSIHGIRFLVGCCAPAMAAGGKGQARFWSKTGPVSSEPCHLGCAILAIVRDWTADRPL